MCACVFFLIEAITKQHVVYIPGTVHHVPGTRLNLLERGFVNMLVKITLILFYLAIVDKVQITLIFQFLR